MGRFSPQHHGPRSATSQPIVRVPVTEKGKLVGIISRIDVIREVLSRSLLLSESTDHS